MRTLTDKKNIAIDLVCDLIRKRQKKPNSELMQQFSRLYYAESIPAELLQFDTDNLYGGSFQLVGWCKAAPWRPG